VEARINIAISGCTNSGKSTLLNVIARWIPLDERIFFLQRVGSAALPHPRVVTLETIPPNIEGKGEVKMLDLVQTPCVCAQTASWWRKSWVKRRLNL
jgi:pilus assembly protein CpaF